VPTSEAFTLEAEQEERKNRINGLIAALEAKPVVVAEE
jgi:hypothetical protein